MGRPCDACNSPRRPGIDARLAAGESPYAIARWVRKVSPRDFKTPSNDSIRRHRKHLSPALASVSVQSVNAPAGEEDNEDRIEWLIGVLRTFLVIAEERGTLMAAARFAQELRQCYELQARRRGELSERTQNVTVNVLSTPEFTSAVGIIYEELEAVAPEVRARIADRLGPLGAELPAPRSVIDVEGVA